MRCPQRDVGLQQHVRTRLFLTLAASVVVCTRDRADDLAALLPHLNRQVVRPEVDWEIVVVDNGSTDATPRVLHEAAARSSVALRTLDVPEPGLAAARNRGWQAASGAIIAFLDDDSIPEPGWLQALLDAYEDPSVAGVVGRLLPRTHGPSLADLDPAWLRIYTFDHGAHPRVVRELTGANMSARRSTLVEIGGLDERLGRIGDCLLAGDDNDLCQSIQNAPGKHRIVYQPTALAHHTLHTAALTPALLIKRTYCGGISNAVLDRKASGAQQLTRFFGRLARIALWSAQALRQRLWKRDGDDLRLTARQQEFVGYARERTGGLARACRGCPLRPQRENHLASLANSAPTTPPAD